MNEKQRLEEIKMDIKKIMETDYVVRHKKAKEVGIDLVMTGKVDYLLQEIDLLNEQNQRYKQALEFYADESNYEMKLDKSKSEPFTPHYYKWVERDFGERARQALRGDTNVP